MTDQAKLETILSWAIVLLTPLMIGVIGGAVTWVRPRIVFGPTGWIVALVGGPWAMLLVNNNIVPQKLIAIGYIMLLFHIPVACIVAGIGCGAVFALRP